MPELVLVAALVIAIIFGARFYGLLPSHRRRIRKAAVSRGWEVKSIQHWIPRQKPIAMPDDKLWYRVHYVDADGRTAQTYCRVGLAGAVEWRSDDDDRRKS